MQIQADIYKVSNESKLNAALLKEMIANKKLPKNVFFELKPILDFERYKSSSAAYLILEWTYTIPGIVHFVAETRWKISDYKSPASDDTLKVNHCIVVGMSNYLMIFQEKTGIDMRSIIPELNKDRFAEVSAQILLGLRKQG